MSRKIIWDYWAKFYNQLWVQKWSLGPTRDMIIGHVQALVKTGNNLNILDMGCGTGQLLHDLESSIPNRHIALTGIDYSIGMLKIARQVNPNIKFIQGDVHDFSAPDRFDLIIISHSLPYYENQTTAIRNMVKHLKPGGALIIANASSNNLYDKLCLFMVKMTTGPAHYPSMIEVKTLAGKFMPNVSISKVKTHWFVPTIFFLVANMSGSDQ